jgi:type IV pilus assembly protein PilC
VTKFSYTALATDGSRVTGIEDADSASVLHAALVDRGMQPIAIEVKKGFLQFEITKKKVKRREIQQFSRQMAVFIRAGIPVLDALDVIAEECGDKLFKAVLLDMADSLRAGATFAGAASAHPEAFPPLYLSILHSAELTGNLDTVLDQLSEYLERDLEARRKISSALIYPMVVMVMSVVTVLVLAIFVLPRFEKFFASLDADLPLPTRMLLATSGFFGDWWWIFAILLVATIIGILIALRTQGGRDVRDALLLKIPVAGELVKYAVYERFCRVLASLVSAGVPLPDAMSVTSEATNNAVFRRGLSAARDEMLRGEGLAGPLARTELFPSAARQIFMVGENTGTLDTQLTVAANYFDDELDHRLTRFTNLFEPAVIVMMGAVVGFVAVALVSAMYGIFNQVEV